MPAGRLSVSSRSTSTSRGGGVDHARSPLGSIRYGGREVPGGRLRIVALERDGDGAAGKPGRVLVRGGAGAGTLSAMGDSVPDGASGGRGTTISAPLGPSGLRGVGGSLFGRRGGTGVTATMGWGWIGTMGSSSLVADGAGIGATCADEDSPADSSSSCACMRNTSSAPVLSTKSRANARARRASPAASQACAARSWSS